MTSVNRSASPARFLVVWVVLAGTALLLNARSFLESVPHHEPLETFPRELQGWSGQDLPMTPDVLEVLGPGDFLSRIYKNSSVPEMVDLFIAYYPSQRTGDTIHSPQNCMPGAGWLLLEGERLQIHRDDPKDGAVTANRFIFAKGMERVFVLYWYQARGQTTPSEYWAKLYLVRDSIARHRTDGAIVRIATRIGRSADEAQAESRAVAFAKLVLTNLDNYVPR